MKSIVIDKNVIEANEKNGWKHYVAMDRNIFIRPSRKMSHMPQRNKGKAAYDVYLETEPRSCRYMELWFECCMDLAKAECGNSTHFNKSKTGKPYFGILICRKPDNNDSLQVSRDLHETKIEFSKWRNSHRGQTYARMCDVFRCITGMFADSGVTVEDISRGAVFYDDLIDYVKAWWEDTVLGYKYEIPTSEAEFYTGDNKTTSEEDSFGLPELDVDIPW